jgi:pre-mRNA-processing factor 40
MSTDRRTSKIPADTLRLIFSRLREKVLRRSDEDRHAQRRAVDALRSRIKHLEPPISSSDTFEQVRPRLEKLEEFGVLESDDLRIQAFDKVIRRLKEREEEDRESSRRSRDSPRRDHRERDSHRDYDSRRSDSHRPRHRTRTPETDAYAADRKKAQADRERQYRKGSAFGLSPPPSAGGRRDATDRYVPSDNRDRLRSPRERGDRYDGRGSARSSGAAHLSRADPREAANSAELDYGDSSAVTSVRRRRTDSEDADGTNERDAKRMRSSRDESEGTAGKSEKEDVAYKSGSEEGEIEEE